MIAPEVSLTSALKKRPAIDADDMFLPLELLELELSLEGYQGGLENFCEAVRQAASGVGGSFLFDLPADGLVEDCYRVAVISIPASNNAERIVLALLDKDGMGIRIELPDETTEPLVRLAEAFIGVLKQI